MPLIIQKLIASKFRKLCKYWRQQQKYSSCVTNPKHHLKVGWQQWQQLISQQWCRCFGRGRGCCCRWAHVGWQSGARQSGASGVKRAEKTAGGSEVLQIATAPTALICKKYLRGGFVVGIIVLGREDIIVFCVDYIYEVHMRCGILILCRIS